MDPAALGALTRGDISNFVVASTPGGIAAQEARGQAVFCASEILPKRIQGNTRADLESIGFSFGDDHDDIFVKATLPAGWSKRPSDHSMWSHIVDEKGRERAAIFYKAAFYDRSAHISLTPRFGYSGYENGSDKEHFRTVVKDGGVAILELGERSSRDYDAGDELEKQAMAWLDQRYPEFQNPLKYWD